MPDNMLSALEMMKVPFPKLEVPDRVKATFRDLAQKAAGHATKAIETLEKVTEDATKLVEIAGSNAATGALDYNRKLVESLARKCACSASRSLSS